MVKLLRKQRTLKHRHASWQTIQSDHFEELPIPTDKKGNSHILDLKFEVTSHVVPLMPKHLHSHA